MTEYKTQKTDDFIAKDLGSRGHIHTLALIAMTTGGLYLCY